MSVLGHVFVPSSGSTVGQFQFILQKETAGAVEIGTLVRADTVEGPMIGAVVDMRSVGHNSDAFHAYHMSELETSRQRGVVMVATVAVYSSPRLRPTSNGPVYSATVADVDVACAVERFKWAVPVGVLPLVSGGQARVLLDGHALLGPEAGHLMIGGLSGQAAKTSYASVMLKLALAAGGPDESVAALLFNVKGSDLLFLDRPPLPGYELSPEDLEIWSTLQVDPTPFDDVAVYAPTLPNTSETRSLRADAQPLSWSLRDIWPYLRYLFPNIYADEKAASFFADLGELIYRTRDPIDTFSKLRSWFDEKLSISEFDEKTETYPWNNHHRATMMRMRRMLEGLPKRCGGLLSNTASEGTDVPLDFVHGSVVVVDIAGLDPLVQSLVVARTLERVLVAAEESQLHVDHLITLVDELNTYAPASGGEYTEVRKILQRVSTQGRYAGLSLWGMAQMLSKIDDLVRDNAATRALGMTTDGELSSGVYGKLTNGLSEVLATLPKGQMVLWHYSLRSPTRIRFPRPGWQMGRAPRQRRRATAADTIMAGVVGRENLTVGLSDRQVADIVASADSQEQAVDALKAQRKLDATVTKIRIPRSGIDDANPFGLD